MMKVPFESEEADLINKMMFETIYHGAVEMSHEIALVEGAYESFPGSPMSQGKFQFDMWGVTPITTRYDWNDLRTRIMEKGIRNSLLLAPMPTASTSQILRNNESFEPYTSNVYARRVLAGEFMCINPHLVNDLIKEGLWTSDIKNQLVAYNGSVQQIAAIPPVLKELYKTIWEIPQKTLMNLAIGRGPYICQS
jgi:ribonucleoside-diphosphate reductase alpha chain